VLGDRGGPAVATGPFGLMTGGLSDVIMQNRWGRTASGRLTTRHRRSRSRRIRPAPRAPRSTPRRLRNRHPGSPTRRVCPRHRRVRRRPAVGPPHHPTARSTRPAPAPCPARPRRSPRLTCSSRGTRWDHGCLPSGSSSIPSLAGPKW